MSADTSNVLFEKGLVSRVTINRPKSLNALNPAVLAELKQIIATVAEDSEARVLTIWGAGEKAFVAGADISSMSEMSASEISDYVALGQEVMCAIEECKLPVIAAVDGFALGGGMELALACDLILASEGSRLGQPEVKLGILPGFGGTQRLLQRCGIGMTRRLIYTGEMIGAEEASRIGLVDKLFSSEEFESGVLALAETIAAQGPLAVSASKRAIASFSRESLHKGLQTEVAEFVALFQSKDRKEGMQAFLEKRPPVFTGV